MSKKFTLAVLFVLILLQVAFSQAANKCPGGSMPDKAFVAGFPDSVQLAAEAMLKSGRLTINAGGYEIAGFTLSGCWSPNGGYVEVSISRADFSEKMKQLIRRSEPGQRIYFSGIIAKNKSGQLFCVDDLELRIR